ncbi:MAG: MBL fold metallo-hydrolase [Cyanobacteria bacterium PR.3.49]|nr:MBL fold metallo-hydrolase [Cyanobacteria bacterium PR.3.49]
MADPQKIVSNNAPGNFFVDTTCINCDTCRQLAPTTFEDAGEYSSVSHQPATDEEVLAATRALLCCPTGSIGTKEKDTAKIQMTRAQFPLPIEENVYYSGFNSPHSYGANSFFVLEEGGNWLIDSPKYLPFLADRFAELGGIKYIFLTHRDDVADAEKYAGRFSSSRIIHAAELSAQPQSEIVVESNSIQEFSENFTIIPVPGHTKGHMVLLYKNKFLFTGDHLAFDPELSEIYAFRNHCWYSWTEQTASMERLSEFQFEWILAGHGDRVKLPASDMKDQMHRLVERMKRQ